MQIVHILLKFVKLLKKVPDTAAMQPKMKKISLCDVKMMNFEKKSNY
jgi:hypothetical protein